MYWASSPRRLDGEQIAIKFFHSRAILAFSNPLSQVLLNSQLQLGEVVMLYLSISTHSQAMTPLHERQFATNFVLILCCELNKCMLTNLTLIGLFTRRQQHLHLKKGARVFCVWTHSQYAHLKLIKCIL